MVTVTVNLENLGKLQDKSKEVVNRGLRLTGQDLIRNLMINSPVDHGLLKEWAVTSQTDNEIIIQSPAEYAAAQNYGARAHDIFIAPVNKKALFWGAFDGDKPIMSKGHMVHIPAMEGKHFVEHSIEQTQSRISEFFTINGG